MPAFLFMSSDAFDQRFRRSAGNVRSDGQTWRGDMFQPAIRRPYRGLQVKDDTYATFSVITSRGEHIPLISESSVNASTDVGGRGYVKQYGDFMLSRVTERRVEKQQVVETFGDDYIFFFGERPRVVTIAGQLISSEDFNWKSQFWVNWESSIRGTRLVQRNARFFFAYDTVVVEGYPLEANVDIQSEQPHLMPFTMTIFVTNEVDFGDAGYTAYPRKDASDLANVDALNRQLRDQADAFTANSIPLEVRTRNLRANQGFRSLGSALREELKAVNNIANTVFGAIDAVRSGAFSLLNGRVVTVPLGVSGFASQVGAATFASASINENTRTILTARGIEIPVRVNQTYFTEVVNPRGRKSDSKDEYPLVSNQAYEIPSQLAGYLELARLERQARSRERDARLVKENIEAQGLNDTLRGVAATIQFAKTAFTMVRTAQNVVQNIANSADPAAATGIFLANSLAGVGIVPGRERFADPSSAAPVATPPNLERFRDPAAAGVVQDAGTSTSRFRSSEPALGIEGFEGSTDAINAGSFLEQLRGDGG